MSAIAGKLVLRGGAAPSNPSAGSVAVYTKGDGTLYVLDENGNETAVGGGGGSNETQINFSGTFDPSLGQPVALWADVGDALATPLVPGVGRPSAFTTAMYIKCITVNVYNSTIDKNPTLELWVNNGLVDQLVDTFSIVAPGNGTYLRTGLSFQFILLNKIYYKVEAVGAVGPMTLSVSVGLSSVP